MTDYPPLSPPSPWHVLGTGAIGGLFACKMQDAGIPVYALPTPNSPPTQTLDLILEDGGTQRTYSLAIDTLSIDKRGPIQQLLLTTKAHQSEAALQRIADRLLPQATIVVLQNGLGIQEWISNTWPQLHIVAGTTTAGANRPDRHHIRYAGKGTTWLGPWRSIDSSACRQVLQAWQPLQMTLEFDSDIQRRLWEKLVINCAINPLTALLDCPNGELLKRADTLSAMHVIVQEVALLMNASGINADAEALYEKAKTVAKNTGANISSMLQDVRNQRTTEIDFINGYVARKAQETGVRCSVNSRLAAAIQGCEKIDLATLI